MIISPFSKKQLERAEKVIVKKPEETENKIYFDVVYIDRTGRHEHTISYDKNIKDIKASLHCDCVACSSFEINTKRFCIYKIAVAKKLVETGKWKNYILRWINGR